MKAYCIDDDIRAKEKGTLKRWTSYEYSFDRDRVLNKRLERYEKLGYKVEVKQEWWTTKKIVEVK